MNHLVLFPFDAIHALYSSIHVNLCAYLHVYVLCYGYYLTPKAKII